MSLQNPFDSRVRCNQAETSPSGYPYRVDEGGTHSTNAPNGLIELEAIPIATVGQQNSPVALDLYRVVLDENTPGATINQEHHLTFVSEVNAGGHAEFVITNFTYTHDYTISPIGLGSVELSGDKIIYQAPMAATESGDGFELCGRRILIDVIGEATASVEKPIITFPNEISGLINVSITPIIQTTPFIYIDFPQTHLSSDWELATDALFSNLIYSSYNDITNKVDWYPGILENNTVYYIRARHNGGISGPSEWADTVSFTTVDLETQPSNYVKKPLFTLNGESPYIKKDYYSGIEKPSIIQYPNDIDNVSVYRIARSTPLANKGPRVGGTVNEYTHTVFLDDFDYIGISQEYVSTTWEVALDSQFLYTVLKTTNSVENKKELTIEGLSGSETYYIRAKFRGNLSGESEWSDTITLTVDDSFVPQKITFEYDDDTDIQHVVQDNPVYRFGSAMAINAAGDLALIGHCDRHIRDTLTNLYYTHAGCVLEYEKLGAQWKFVQRHIADSDFPDDYLYYGSRIEITDSGDIWVTNAPGCVISSDPLVKGKLYSYGSVSQVLDSAFDPNIREFGNCFALSKDGLYLAVLAYCEDPNEYSPNYDLLMYRNVDNVWELWYRQNFLNITHSAVAVDFCFNTQTIEDVGGPILKSMLYIACVLEMSSNSNIYDIYSHDPLNPNNLIPSNTMFYGTRINGETTDAVIKSLSLSVSNTETRLAVGMSLYYDSLYDQNYNGNTDYYSGYVRLCEKDIVSDTWRYGDYISTNDPECAIFGSHVELSPDGQTLVVAGESSVGLPVPEKRSIYVFQYNQYHWTECYRYEPVHIGRLGNHPVLKATIPLDIITDLSIIYTDDSDPDVHSAIVEENILLNITPQEHKSTTWELSRNSDFSLIDYNLKESNIYLTHVNLPKLDYDIQYYIRAKYHTDRYTSDWSDGYSFHTDIYRPDISGEFYSLQPLYEDLDYNPSYTDPTLYYFGTAIDIDSNGGTFVAGCPNKSTMFNISSGALYIYEGYPTVFDPEAIPTTTLIEPNKDNISNLGVNGKAWSGICCVGNNIYTSVYNGNIYKRINGVGSFVNLNQTDRNYSDIVAKTTDVYACVYGGDIYKQTNGTGDFVALNQTTRYWNGLAVLGDDVYACVYGGDIYKQTNGTGDFVALGLIAKNWSALAVNINGLYGSTNTGDIYKIEKDINENYITTSLEHGNKAWLSLCGLDDTLYGSLESRYDPIQKIDNTNTLFEIGHNPNQWSAIATDGTYLYFAQHNGDIYKVDPAFEDYSSLGYCVSMGSNGDKIIAGISQKTIDTHIQAGCVKVYVKNSGYWQVSHTLISPAPMDEEQFGSSVALDDAMNFIAVGQNTDSGKVRLYYPNDTVLDLVQTLEPDDVTYPSTVNGFGTSHGSIVFSGDGSMLFIAAKNTTVDSHDNTGVVYVYKRIFSTHYQYQFVTIIEPPVAGDGYYFGNSLATNNEGNILIIGCPGIPEIQNEQTVGCGSVYVYRQNVDTWSLENTLTRPTQSLDFTQDKFGTSVAIDKLGTTLYIYNHNGLFYEECIAFEFNYADNVWTWSNQYRPSSFTGQNININAINDWSTTIAVNKDLEISKRLLISAPKDDNMGYSDVGSVYAMG